jgi:hypothetical protein
VVEIEILVPVFDEKVVVAALSVSDLWPVALCSTIPQDGVPEAAFRIVRLLQWLRVGKVVLLDAGLDAIKIVVEVITELKRLLERHSLVFHEVACLYLSELPELRMDGGCTGHKTAEIRACTGQHIRVKLVAMATIEGEVEIAPKEPTYGLEIQSIDKRRGDLQSTGKMQGSSEASD